MEDEEEGRISFELPAYIDWRFHRIATSGHYHDGLHTIETEWSLADVFEANEVIDAIEHAQAEAMRQRTKR
jgi:hypothetical protein